MMSQPTLVGNKGMQVHHGTLGMWLPCIAHAGTSTLGSKGDEQVNSQLRLCI